MGITPQNWFRMKSRVYASNFLESNSPILGDKFCVFKMLSLILPYRVTVFDRFGLDVVQVIDMSKQTDATKGTSQQQSQ